MKLANSRALYTGERLCGLSDLPNIKLKYPHLPNRNAVFIVSHYIRAIALENKWSNYPIVLYVDMHNENLLAIFYENAIRDFHYGFSPNTPWEDINDPLCGTQKLLETISNGILPNMSIALTNTLVTAIMDYCDNTDNEVTTEVAKLIIATENKVHRRPIEALYPRSYEKVELILRDLFNRYNVDEKLPSDLRSSPDKTWVYKGQDPSLPNHYLEVEVRQAYRSVDHGFEFKVIDPGYKRRIIDVDALKFNV